jgi:hypothetical protein
MEVRLAAPTTEQGLSEKAPRTRNVARNITGAALIHAGGSNVGSPTLAAVSLIFLRRRRGEAGQLFMQF